MAIFALETAGGINVAADAPVRQDNNIVVYGKERLLSHAAEIDVFLSQQGAMNQASVETIIAELEKGRDVAFLTLGDSLTYATYGYVLKYVLALAPDAPVVTVPCITAYQAAAALCGLGGFPGIHGQRHGRL